MALSKLYKKNKRAVGGLVVGGIGLSLGSQIAGEVGATSTQTAIGNITNKFPAMGSIVGAGMVLDSLSMLEKSANIKKKKRFFK